MIRKTMSKSDNKHSPAKPPRSHPFRRAVLRGLAVILPPLLTIVIFVWVGSTINTYVMQPVKDGARWVLIHYYDDGVAHFPDLPPDQNAAEKNGIAYRRLPSKQNGSAGGQWVPAAIYDVVAKPKNLGEDSMPTSRNAVFAMYVDLTWLTPQKVIPVFTCIFILTMYLLGKFLAAGIGRLAWIGFEKGIERLPLIRNVYGSVKQVTDFVFSESTVEYTRVIAVEYPRKGIWSLGMVTGESMLDIASVANEPVLSVLIPTSPAPFTGFTVTIKKSEAVDLNLTIDQAFQFIVSCGVVIAPQQVSQIAAGSDEVEAEEPAALSNSGPSAASESAIPTSGKKT